MKNLFLTITLATALTLASFTASAAIDTTTIDAGTITSFGTSNTATYGQTFIPGAGDTNLSSFSMYLRNRAGGSGTLDLRGYIATWDGSKAGSILFESVTHTMNAAGTLQEFAFATDIAVAPGDTYVAFISTSNLAVQPDSRFGMPYAGNLIPGQFVYMNNGTNFSALTSSNWENAGNLDAWLKAEFNEVATPEPASMALIGLGLAALGMARRRRA